LVKFFGDAGAYFDIGSESNNLFQIPDLRQLPEKQRQERLDDYKEFLVKALDTMVMGTETEGQLGKRVHTVLWQALAAFFANAQIQKRYDTAFKKGFGSKAWVQMPTLVDFVESIRHLDLEVESAMVSEAVATILLELKGWLTSRVGRTIAQPSTIRTEDWALSRTAFNNWMRYRKPGSNAGLTFSAVPMGCTRGSINLPPLLSSEPSCSLRWAGSKMSLNGDSFRRCPM
jgi:hypothetical protein